MPEDEKLLLKKPEGHGCFACGTDNPIGLNLCFYRSGDLICSDITLDRNYEGWEHMAHGGIVFTLLDEVMSWTLMYYKKAFFVTRKMDVKYVRPIFIGTPLTASGKLVDDSEPPKVRASAEIRDDENHLLVRSRGEFVLLAEEDLPSVPDGMKKEMLALFEGF
jgi:uncharacterized protein (TIGR00369 family)